MDGLAFHIRQLLQRLFIQSHLFHPKFPQHLRRCYLHRQPRLKKLAFSFSLSPSFRIADHEKEKWYDSGTTWSCFHPALGKYWRGEEHASVHNVEEPKAVLANAGAITLGGGGAPALYHQLPATIPIQYSLCYHYLPSPQSIRQLWLARKYRLIFNIHFVQFNR